MRFLRATAAAAKTETLAPPVERSAACLHWERDIENEIAA